MMMWNNYKKDKIVVIKKKLYCRNNVIEIIIECVPKNIFWISMNHFHL